MLTITRPKDMSDEDMQKFILVAKRLGLSDPVTTALIYFREGLRLSKYNFAPEDAEIVLEVSQ